MLISDSLLLHRWVQTKWEFLFRLFGIFLYKMLSVLYHLLWLGVLKVYILSCTEKIKQISALVLSHFRVVVQENNLHCICVVCVNIRLKCLSGCMCDWVNEVCSVMSFEWSMRAEKCHISTSPTAIFVLVCSFTISTPTLQFCPASLRSPCSFFLPLIPQLRQMVASMWSFNFVAGCCMRLQCIWWWRKMTTDLIWWLQKRLKQKLAFKKESDC